MKNKSPLIPRPASGFTLIELLVVMAIIATLATLGIGLFSSTQQTKKAAQTRADINLLANGIQSYHSDNGVYPGQIDKNGMVAPSLIGNNGEKNTSELYQALFGDYGGVTGAGSPDGKTDDGREVYVDGLNPLTNTRKMMKTSGTSYLIVDGWGNELFYRLGTVSGNNNTADNPDFDLWSTGKNPANEEDADDILLE